MDMKEKFKTGDKVQQYQDLVDALIRYNALVDRFPDAPKFKLVTL